MSLWQKYRATAPKTRLLLGVGLMAYGAFGLFASDEAEKAFNMVPTEEEKKRLDSAMPKIHIVDQDDKPLGSIR
ncbi:uncharacterized protein K452DRAFT_291082 [Aplosporella prunicola CBS 121167]|uniref:Uncharacterized protein n=1 Tax=Aplosporella prunicola CBS 121167 TaxID=1176127 RepID=A0A6A6B1F6_9PEZI|nr:uncharacterized protein K452DRAFT_291082 [Aplosporella prunicola CBS 121167]KAF2138042.1 hypothetical protein K452DRAFT_291082 [Aplosporella prunicola CBS 121167]